MRSFFQNRHLDTVLRVFKFTIFNGCHHGTPYMTFLFAFNHILQKLTLSYVGSMLKSVHYLVTFVGINASSIKSFIRPVK